MYCSSCGSAVAQNSSYCNHCGAGLSSVAVKGDASLTVTIPESLVWAIVSVSLGGLGLIIALIAVLKEYRFSNDVILLLSLLSFLMFIGAESILVWLLLRFRNHGGKQQGDTARLKDASTKELGPAQARALAEPTSGITEHTTRSLDPLYRERNVEEPR